jgi:hypothetical protein
MDFREEKKKKLIDIIQERKEVIAGDDGFYCYWPEPSRGFLSSDDLRIIADYLDEINKPWQKQIDRYFNEQRAEDQIRLDPLGFHE